MTEFHPELANLPCVLDFEASSLSDNSYPISVGLLLAGKAYQWMIRPRQEWVDWSTRAEALHGIPRARLINEGQDVDSVCRQIAQLLGSAVLIYSDNPEWEQFWAGRMGLGHLTFSDIRLLISPAKSSQFHLAVAQFRKQMNLRAHDAMHDAIAMGYAINFLSGQ